MSRFAPRRLLSAPLLLAIGLVLILASWIGATAPGNAPDEPANYIKAIGAGRGQLLGTPGELQDASFPPAEGEPQRIAWINSNTRAFVMPAGLAPAPLTCNNEQFAITLPTLCSVTVAQPPKRAIWFSYVGTYQPYVYALAGFAMNATSDSITALYVGRGVIAAICALFLVLAVAASWDRRTGVASLAGVSLAASPMVLFMGAVLGANGVEIASALCLFATVLRSARADPPGWLWASGAASAAATVLARPTGLAWLVMAAAIAVTRHGPRRVIGSLRIRGARLIAASVVAVAVAACVAWDQTLQPHPALSLGRAWRSLGYSLNDLVRIGKEWIGVFGWASVSMNRVVYAVVIAAAVGLLVAAFAVGGRRDRLLLVGTVCAAYVVTVAMDAFVFQQTYFPVYGRYVLPLGMLMPLVCSDVLSRRSPAHPSRLPPLAATTAVVVMAAVQLIGVWTSARRSAVGTDGPVWFIGHSKYAPPGGWSWVVALAVAGALLCASAAVAHVRVTSVGPSSEPAPAAA